MERKPALQWYSGIEDKTSHEKLLVSSIALKQLKSFLLNDIETLRASTVAVEDFDSPSWALKQAYLNGRIAELNRILELLGFVS
jgi:hypothetical protein